MEGKGEEEQRGMRGGKGDRGRKGKKGGEERVLSFLCLRPSIWLRRGWPLRGLWKGWSRENGSTYRKGMVWIRH